MELRKGTIVKYIGCSQEQVNWGNNTDPNGILMPNSQYYVERVEVHSQHTKLELRGVKGKFNSVCFEVVNDTRRNA